MPRQSAVGHKQLGSNSRLQQRRCCWVILGVILLWCSLCVVRFSSTSHSDQTQIAPDFSASLHPSSISNVALLSTLDSSASKTLPRASLNFIRPIACHNSSLHHQHKFGASFSASSNLPFNSNCSDPCFGKRIYIHRLPKMFNEDLLASCNHFNPWKNMCKVFSNGGLGPKLETTQDMNVISNDGWFATNQFALELIFHNRLKRYKCLTTDSRKAALIYVPFYAGLDISRYLWGGKVSERDNLSLALAGWLKRQDEWRVMGGKDHFMVFGRMTWDFRRLTDAESGWGNKLLRLEVTQNMSTLLIDKSPWHENDFAIPYPTYFHPHDYSEVVKWQERLRQEARFSLFSFAGAPRETMEGSIRAQVIEQCKNSEVCTLLECDKGESKCHSPVTLMKLFQKSVFCLQPHGDSATRRSTFDSIVAGCIPVFFHHHSAYTQYIWHLPQNHSEYSVYISHEDMKAGKANIESILKAIPSSHVRYMRERVISLIPTLIYANPFSPPQFEDAFDVAVKALLDRVAQLRLGNELKSATHHSS